MGRKTERTTPVWRVSLRDMVSTDPECTIYFRSGTLESLLDDADERDELVERARGLERERESCDVAELHYAQAVEKLQAKLARAMTVVEAARKTVNQPAPPLDGYTIDCDHIDLRDALYDFDEGEEA